jgi:hypothetical protein
MKESAQRCHTPLGTENSINNSKIKKKIERIAFRVRRGGWSLGPRLFVSNLFSRRYNANVVVWFRDDRLILIE